MPTRDRSPVGENIRRLRELLGWTQRELQEKAETSAVGMIESGKRGAAPRRGTVVKLAKALGVPVVSLFMEHDTAPNAALQTFLGSPGGADVTDEERELLLWLDVPGRLHTQQSYALLLACLRATKPMGK